MDNLNITHGSLIKMKNTKKYDREQTDPKRNKERKKDYSTERKVKRGEVQ